MIPYRRRTAGSLADSRPVDRQAATTPVTASSAPSTTPTAKGIVSHGGGAARPHPNHTKAKNPSTTTVTPRSRPDGNDWDNFGTGLVLTVGRGGRAALDPGPLAGYGSVT